MIDCVDITLKKWRASEFEWGTRDCMISIADYILLRDGIDFGEKYRGTYNDEIGAVKWINRIGDEAAMISESNLKRVQFAQRGDVVLVDWNDKKMAGICTGPGAAFRLPRGVAEMEMRFLKITHVWR